MHGLMQEIPLMISSLIRYAAEYHGDRPVVSRTVEGPIHRYGYAECERRARRVAGLMGRLGVRQGERVGTLAWNGHRHLELFYGVSGMGAVLHTVNPRLFTEQIVYIINHAEDRVLFVDLTFVELVERIANQLSTVEHVVVMTDEEHMPETSLPNVSCYETLLAGESEDYAWPLFDERAASSLCYTSGTTGNPKGVLYSHRSTLLHAMAACQNSAMGISAHDVLMPIAPMYHGNAWSLPYLGCLSGAGLVLPGTKMDGRSLQELIEGEGVTFALGVPTVFTMLIDHLDESGKQVESLERVAIGGSAVPRSMIERLADPYGVTVHQLWGMTETSPLGTMATATPAIDALGADERRAVLAQQGRVQFGLELAITGEDGAPVPRDGKTFGDMWVRGNWAASGYFKGEGGDRLDERRLVPHRRRRHPRYARLHAHHRPHQGRHQVGRRVDQLDRPRERGDGPPGREAGRRHRRLPSQVGGAAAHGGRAPRRPQPRQGDHQRLPRRQGREVVAARRRGAGRRAAAHRHRQDPEVAPSRDVRGLPSARRLSLTPRPAALPEGAFRRSCSLSGIPAAGGVAAQQGFRCRRLSVNCRDKAR